MPKRIQRKRTKGWRMPEGVVYVGRPSKWGNPFIPYQGDLDFKVLLKRFRIYAEDTLAVEELRGKDLACWCKEGAPCHADILLELANQ